MDKKWYAQFMNQVYLISSMSKDTRTHVGAILVRDKRVVAQGYNGFPYGVDDSVLERYERPLKYEYTEHAERNAVYDCALNGKASKDCILFTQGIPCPSCARGIIQAGVVKLVVHKQWRDYEAQINRDKQSSNDSVSMIMLAESGVAIEIFDCVLGVEGFLDGNKIKV